MATLSVGTIGRAGQNLTTGAVAAGVSGDKFANTGNQFVYINNGSGSSVTVSFAVNATVDGIAVTPKTVTVPAGDAMLIGPFPTNVYNDTQGLVDMTYSSNTSVTVAVYVLGS